MNDESLLYKRQFIAGTKRLTELTDFKVLQFNKLYIHCHPSLDVSIAKSEDITILVLGIILDPREVLYSNQAIVESLVTRIANFDDFEKSIKHYNGRWVCFIKIGQEARIYHDPCALHPVYYTKLPNQQDDVWFATQPGLLADYLGVQKDTNIIDKFQEYGWPGWWPGKLTPYQSTYQLIPNHYLDLNTLESHRYWPQQSLERIELDEAASDIASILKNTILSCLNRSSISISLTGGYDSRMIFACCDKNNSDIEYITRLIPFMPHYDKAIPKALLKKFNSNLRYYRFSDKDVDVLKIYRKNTGNMFWNALSVIHSVNIHINDNQYVLNGTPAENFRSFYDNKTKQQGPLSGKICANLNGFGDNPLAVAEFDSWLNTLQDQININPLDLLLWEHGWIPLAHTANNTFYNSLSPFNCRALLEKALSVDEKFRQPPYPIVRKICEIADPTTLLQPFNYSRTTYAVDKVANIYKSVVPWRVQQFFEAAVWASKGQLKHYRLKQEGFRLK